MVAHSLFFRHCGTMSSACLSDAEIAAFLAGTAGDDERARVDVHVDECNDCRSLLTVLARGEDSVEDTPPASPEADQPDDTLTSGAQIGRYVIMNELGAGGMGAVYAAYDPELDREVAIKVLHRRGDGSEGEQTRLLREARALAKLGHEHIVQVHDAGTTADGQVFLAMELVDGLTLREWLGQNARSWGDIVDMFVQAGRGLAAAHSAGMVHRDFKPENVLVGSDGRLRIGDFGLVRLTGSSFESGQGAISDSQPTTITRTGVALGTPAYMAPEQLAGKQVDHRADQFAFCVALFEALEGRRPFEGDNVAELSRAIGEQSIALADDTTTPDWLRVLLARGLKADRADRFDSMSTVLSEIEDGRAPRRSRATPISLAVAAIAGVGVAVVIMGSSAGSTGASCGLPRALDDAWNTEARARTRQVFLSAKHIAPEHNWQIVRRRVNEYIAGLRTGYTDHCADERRPPEQRVCLDQRSAEVLAYLRVFRDGKDVKHKVERASHGLEYMSDLDDCRRPSYTRGLRAEPETTEARSLRDTIGEVRALHRLALVSRGQDLGGPTLEAAKRLGNAQLTARAIHAMAEGAVVADEKAGVRQLATWTERASKADLPTMHAILATMLARYSRGKPEHVKRAQAAVDSLDKDPGLSLQLLHVRSKLARINKLDSKRARALTKEILDAYDRQKRPNYARLVRMLRNLGTMAVRRRQFELAKQHLSRGLALGARYLGDYHRYTLNILHLLSNVSKDTADYHNAADQFARLVPLLRKHHGADSPSTVVAATRWAEVLAFSGKNVESLRVLAKLETLTAPATSPSHRLYPSVLQGKAVVYALERKHPQAIQLHEQATEAIRKFYGEDHIKFIEAVLRLAKVNAGAGNHAKTVQLIGRYRKAWWRMTKGKMGRATVLMTLGRALKRLGKHDEAIIELERATTADPPGMVNRRDQAIIRFELAALLWQRRPDQRQRAIGLATQAREYAKDLPKTLDSLKTAIGNWLDSHKLVEATK